MIKDPKSLPSVLLLVSISIFFFQEHSWGGDQSRSARAVSIPVIVVNRNGDYVSGLNSTSFSFSAGGHNSLVESVQEIGPLLVGRSKVKVPFLVLDALGSPHQSETRKECLELLANSAANALPISLSEIDHDGLHEIHSVATSNSVLASALLQLDGESRFLNHREQLQSIVSTSEDKSLVAAEAEKLRRFRRGSVEHANMMNTLLAQLSALQQMALALQHAHGRKTVIWLTGYFPVEVSEADDSLTISGYGIRGPFPVQSASIDYQKTIDQLNESQISLFPVQMKWRRETSETATQHAPMPFPETTLGDSTTIGLRRIARSTGGELMAYSDTLQNMVQRAEDQSTIYYLLRVQPELIKGDLRWRSLNVELQDKSLKAKSPDGLFLFNSK